MKHMTKWCGLMGVAVCLCGCATAPRLSELSDEQAWPIVQEAYDRGYSDGMIRMAGSRGGLTSGDTGGLEGEAWSLGNRDALEGKPSRNEDWLRAWIQRQR